MEDYIIEAWEDSGRICIKTTDGTIKFGIHVVDEAILNAIRELLPLMQEALITDFSNENSHFYLSFQKGDKHKYIEFSYDKLLPLEPDQVGFFLN